jgi:3-hydroxyacyl-CoA dehydrogenase
MPGLPVVMVERDADSIARGVANVSKVYDGLVAKGRMTEAQKAATLARFKPSTDYADLADTDLVIEAVFEDLDVKKAVFQQLDPFANPVRCWPPTPRTWTSTPSRPARRARRT